ncbi:MAG: cytochrome c oxidase subunit 4 [Microbacteriaceae bacterium]|nr:cytochrome c oxidase subunit 4 [Cryobacterium sp.]MBX3103860.1 cytochrome c oxidase subunit 4 [Cryobacterium sp.]MCC6375543.1 cytochrome c oxidase subunit 4 [Microbacteriaceae bacterium]
MKTNTFLFWILSVFFFLESAGYTVWSLLDPFHMKVEWVGTLAMALCGILFALIAFFLGMQYRKQGGELPEDIQTANIDDGDTEVGFYSPWSWWPFAIGAGAALTFLGIAIGVWISFIGATLALVCLVGWVFEYYRGYFGR